MTKRENTKPNLLKTYYRLTKPGIIYGNAITAVAGFLLASKGHINVLLLFETLFGISFIIASACVFNNYIDRKIDKKMARTKNRALVKGIISGRNAIIYAIVLGLIGFTVLVSYTNSLTVFLGLIAFFVYIVLYGISKRGSIHGTIIGSIAGALPPVAGYTAVTNQFDTAAILLFLILTLWQMPHFYAIALYRFDDYKAAHIPVLPVKKGMFLTKIHMLFYIFSFIIATLLLRVFGITGYMYLIVVSILGWTWFGLGIKGLFITDTNDTKKWARKMFFFSLIIILVFSLTISLNVVLP